MGKRNESRIKAGSEGVELLFRHDSFVSLKNIDRESPENRMYFKSVASTCAQYHRQKLTYKMRSQVGGFIGLVEVCVTSATGQSSLWLSPHLIVKNWKRSDPAHSR